jgi:glutamine amidotransferase-like uncharacterized protein
MALSACDGADGADAQGSSATDTSGSATQVSTVPGAPTAVTQRSYSTDALLFVGDGTWSSEVSSIKNILNSHGATYQTATSAELDAMTVDEIAQYGILIFPGGSGGTEADSLSSSAHANLREAVQVRGVGYVGFCAGAFIGEAPAPSKGGDVSYGLGIVDGPVLDYYYLENQGTDIAMTLLSFPDGSTQDILWYGGPVTPSKAGGVVAKYPDGNPAISQMFSGAGFVVLSGVHPTATSAILSALGVSSTDGTHTETAWKLFYAALHQQPLSAF